MEQKSLIHRYDYRKIIHDIVIMTIGNFLLAYSVQCFILPNHVLSGGVAGIAVAVQPLIGLSAQMIINILVIGMFILGFLFLGKKFALKTAYSSFCYPLILSMMATKPQWFQALTANPFLASVYGGLLGGIGVGMVLRVGASTGGMDVPPLLLHKYFHLEVSKGIMIVDALTILLGIVTYNVDAVLIGLISAYSCSAAVNAILMFGGHDAKSVQIISEKYELIMESIHAQLERGSTLIPITGGYTQAPKIMILVVVSKNQYPKLNAIVHEIDPHAFMIVSNTMEVKGLGFSFEYKM